MLAGAGEQAWCVDGGIATAGHGAVAGTWNVPVSLQPAAHDRPALVGVPYGVRSTTPFMPAW
jgi:hypothetical protein